MQPAFDSTPNNQTHNTSTQGQEENPERALYTFVLDIHDGLVQNLFAAASQVHTLQQALTRPEQVDIPALQEGLARIAALLESSLYEIRTFIHAFGSADIYHRDLPSLVHELAAQRESMTGMNIQVTMPSYLPALPLTTKVALYRILQEALANAHRHGQATRVQVTLAWQAGRLTLEITDNGRGFTPSAILNAPHVSQHLGLRGMRERVQALGGTLNIISAPGKGTTIRITLPHAEGKRSHEQEDTPPSTTDSGGSRG